MKPSTRKPPHRRRGTSDPHPHNYNLVHAPKITRIPKFIKERIQESVDAKTGLKMLVVDWSYWKSVSVTYPNGCRDKALEACRKAFSADISRK